MPVLSVSHIKNFRSSTSNCQDKAICNNSSAQEKVILEVIYSQKALGTAEKLNLTVQDTPGLATNSKSSAL